MRAGPPLYKSMATAPSDERAKTASKIVEPSGVTHCRTAFVEAAGTMFGGGVVAAQATRNTGRARNARHLELPIMGFIRLSLVTV